MHLCAHRRVMDQFDQFIAEHHGPGSRGQIVTDGKTPAVDHLHLARALVLGQVFQALHQTFSVGFAELADRNRVGRKKIGRGQRVEPLAHPERGAAPVVFGHRRGVVDRLPDPTGIEQILLLEQVVEQIVAPFAGVEARVAFGRFDVVFLFQPEHAPQSVHLQGANLARQPVDGMQPFLRMLRPRLLRLENRRVHAEGIEHRLQGARQVGRRGRD